MSNPENSQVCTNRDCVNGMDIYGGFQQVCPTCNGTNQIPESTLKELAKGQPGAKLKDIWAKLPDEPTRDTQRDETEDEDFLIIDVTTLPDGTVIATKLLDAISFSSLRADQKDKIIHLIKGEQDRAKAQGRAEALREAKELITRNGWDSIKRQLREQIESLENKPGAHQ